MISQLIGAQFSCFIGTSIIIYTMPSVVFSNFNSDRRLGQPLYQKFTEYDVKVRTQTLLEKLKDPKDIYCIFEIEQPTVDAVKTAVQNDYQCLVGVYNNSQQAFRYLVLVPKFYTIVSCQNICLSKNYTFVENKDRPQTDDERRQSSEYMSITGGDLFEKAMMFMVLKDESGVKFNLVVTHLGLGVPARLFQSAKLVEWVKNNISSNDITIIGGDLNSFDPKTETVCTEQMEIFLKDGYTNLVAFNTPTFWPYDFDIRYMLKGDDLKTYDDFIARSKVTNGDSADMVKLATEFYDFCTDRKTKVKGNDIALDNVFVKGIDPSKTSVEIINQFCNSDHSAIKLWF
ncbi:hypothetical protein YASMINEVIRUS_123 [Yasminevirus sp. GU-2018]|uniref:Endonuclease/exonuclease/phosphatase domain-containing protein n=1 Tax=Yasminevirus sp. GU-2018 TaxID=2420051 RepID=A0A5K0U781_9VIRU|nr:hypothetical protein YASMINEVIRUS_123 [Yasminevirus sp. GU-2018]